MVEAKCFNRTEEMFPREHKDITYIRSARQICKGRPATKELPEDPPCPVRKQCLEYALQFPPADMHGVWAGMTSRQLAAEQRRRNIRPTRPTIAQAHAMLKK